MSVARRTLIAITLSVLASTVLADVLVQPGYEQRGQQYQTVQRESIPAEQYNGDEQAIQYVFAQPLTDYLGGIQEVYADDLQPRAHILAHHPLRHYSRLIYAPRPRPLHVAKLGGLGVLAPSTLVGQPLAVHYRYRRSTDKGPNSDEAVANDDVAKKPSLTSQDSTVVDSEIHKSRDALTEKEVDKRQSRGDHAIVGAVLQSNAEKQYPGYHQYQPSNTLENTLLGKHTGEERKSEQTGPSQESASSESHSVQVQSGKSQVSSQETARTMPPSYVVFHGPTAQRANVLSQIPYLTGRNFPDPRPPVKQETGQQSESPKTESQNDKPSERATYVSPPQSTLGPQTMIDPDEWMTAPNPMVGAYPGAPQHSFPPFYYPRYYSYPRSTEPVAYVVYGSQSPYQTEKMYYTAGTQGYYPGTRYVTVPRSYDYGMSYKTACSAPAFARPTYYSKNGPMMYQPVYTM